MIPDIKARLLAYEERGLWRRRLCRTNPDPSGRVRLAGEDRALLSFISNDYLELSGHPKVIEAVARAARDYGHGSGGSALLGGYTELARQLETETADWLGFPAAVLVGSGFLANLAVSIGVLGQSLRDADVDAGCRWIIDHNAHASILDAAKLSAWPLSRFRHNDLGHLSQLLDKHCDEATAVITEGLFSMDGDSPDLKGLCSAVLGRAALIIDEAHSFGVLGLQGRGITTDISDNNGLVAVLPLGKAVGGYGAVVCGSRDAIDAIIEFARSYIYSTALPPPVVAGNLASVRLLPELDELRNRLRDNIAYLHRCLDGAGLSHFGNDRSPIQLIPCQNNSEAVAVAEHMRGHGVLIGAIRSPTVQRPRLRLSLRCGHSRADIDGLVDCLSQANCPWQPER